MWLRNCRFVAVGSMQGLVHCQVPTNALCLIWCIADQILTSQSTLWCYQSRKSWVFHSLSLLPHNIWLLAHDNNNNNNNNTPSTRPVITLVQRRHVVFSSPSSSSSSSSLSSTPIGEHSHLHKLTSLWTILHTHPCCIETKFMGPKVELYCMEPCPPWSTCPASPMHWRMIEGCSNNARVVLWWVGSRKMSEQTESSLCDNWGDWGWPVLCLTSSLVICAVHGICTIRRRHHWSNASRRRLDAQSYSTCQLHKEVSEYIHIVKSNLGLQTDGRSPDVTV